MAHSVGSVLRMNLNSHLSNLPSLGPVTGHLLLLVPVTFAPSCPCRLLPSSLETALGESSWSTKSFLTTVMLTRFSQSSYILKDYVGLTELVAQFDSRIILRKDKMNGKDTNVYFIIFL